MSTTKLNGKQVEDIQLDSVDPADYPKFCDAFIDYAIWADTGKELTESELDLLNNDSDLVHELAHESFH